MRTNFDGIKWVPVTGKELSDRITNPEILTYWKSVSPREVQMASSARYVYFRFCHTIVVQSKRDLNERYCGTCLERFNHKSPAYLEKIVETDLGYPACSNSKHLSREL